MAEAGGPLSDAIVVISDLVEAQLSFSVQTPPAHPQAPARKTDSSCAVTGGYLERLPLAAVRAGLANFVEIWHHHQACGIATQRDNDLLTRRAFPVDSEAPFHSEAMLQFIAEYGAPRILCIWGLGVSERILDACAASTIVYNSIDVPPLRVPPEVSRHFDLVLTGAQWQSDDVRQRHPTMPTAILPIGPEFASPQTFFPIADAPKFFDVAYVAAAQPYKEHDMLFAALARSPRPLRTLCVMGYGEDGDRLRQHAAEQGLDVVFVGPPGVSHAEVNILMNQARVGVVCGANDGAPAILTEYMLAGLPVVANANLRCGLQYILPQTGIVAPPEQFEIAILEALARTDFSPRQTVIDLWAWPHSIGKLADLMGNPKAASNPTHAQPEFV